MTTQHPRQVGTDQPPSEEEHGWKWWPLAAVCTAVFMLLIDITVVNVALPDIQRELNASFDSLQWVIDAYALSLASFQLITGVLGDRLGRRSVFAAGITIFGLASLACGLATSAFWLDVFRALQGVGGSIMFANSLAILGATYFGKDRGTAFGIWGATTGASIAIGPLVGGALTTWFGWRWIFFVNLPIAAVAITITLAKLGRLRAHNTRKLDPAGFVLFSVGLALLVYGLIRGNNLGWTSGQILAVLGGALAAFVLFVIAETRVREPMLNLGFFRRRAFLGAQVAAFGISASLFGLFLYLTLYLQDILGFSALEAGIRLLPVSVMTLLVAPAAGKLSAHVPFRALIGTGLVAVGVGLMLMTLVSPGSGWTTLLPGFVIAGAGSGMINAPLGSLATAVVPQAQPGVGAGINNTFRQVGIATAVAAYGVVFQNAVTSGLSDRLSGMSGVPVDRLGEAVSSGALPAALEQVPAAARDQVRQAASASFVDALNQLFWISGTVAIVAAVLCFVLIRQSGVQIHRDGAG